MTDEQWPLIGRAAELARLSAADAGAVVVGPAGVGKSRLARDFAATLAADRPVIVIAGTASASRLPLGAMSRLLPSAPPRPSMASPVEQALAALAAVGSRAAASPLLFVDDAHLLDEACATVVQQAVLDGLVAVLATVRSGEPVPDAISALWKDLGAARIDLGGLSDDAVRDLVAAALPGTVDGIALKRITSAVQGNALTLRELIASAREIGLLECAAGVWRLTGPLTAVPRLTELLRARIGALTPAERSALEFLAVAEPVGLRLLAELVPDDVLEALERRGLIAMGEDGRRREVRLTHPLYGELLRSAMPSIAALRHNRRIAEAVEALGARRREDVARLAVWRLDGGGEGVPALLLAAARQAEAARDLALTARLARAALDSGGGHPAALLLAVACFDTGRHVEAAELLTGILQDPAADDDLLASVPMVLSGPLTVGSDDADGLFAAIAGARGRITDRQARQRLDAVHGHLLRYVNGTDEALALCGPLADAPDPLTRATALIGLGSVDGLQGRLDAAVERTASGVRALLATGLPVSSNHDGLLGWQAWQLVDLPDLARAREAALSLYHRATEQRARPGQGFACFVLAKAELRAGRLGSAQRMAEEAFAVFSDLDVRTFMRWNAALRLQAAAQMGDVAAADAAARDMRALARGPHGARMFDDEVAVAQAWYDWLRGDPGAARAGLTESIRESLAGAAPGTAMTTALEMLRLGFGDVGETSATVRRIGVPPTWRLGRMIADYAAGGPERLADVAHRFGEVGMALAAAEAWSSAAEAFAGAGRARMAAEAERHSAHWLSRCEGAATPALRDRARSPRATLSPREYEIAMLAARGDSTRAIADALVVSARTVDNHLARAYVKLGISSRSELREALGLADGFGGGPGTTHR